VSAGGFGDEGPDRVDGAADRPFGERGRAQRHRDALAVAVPTVADAPLDVGPRRARQLVAKA
jgi:hypothetical protein